jgi:hypothetical protein
MINFQTMTLEEAINYCYEHQDQYVREYDTVSEGMRQFECLITILEDGTITPAELPTYGMEY